METILIIRSFTDPSTVSGIGMPKRIGPDFHRSYVRFNTVTASGSRFASRVVGQFDFHRTLADLGSSGLLDGYCEQLVLRVESIAGATRNEACPEEAGWKTSKGKPARSPSCCALGRWGVVS